MAKDVNLSSKEWTDIVFEGKNKEYGAYTMRQNSPKRHTTAVVIVMGVLVVAVIFLVLALSGAFKSADAADAQGDMVAVDIGADEIEEEPEMVQEIETPPEPEPEPQQAEEDVTASQAVTEIKLVEVVDEDKKIKDKTEILEDTRVISNKDYEGVEDLSKEKVIAEVVENPKPAPEPAPVVKPEEPKVIEKPKDEGPVNMAMVEQKPMFPGGDAAMMQWLSSNINYPPAAAEEGISGKVTVQFIVEKDGSVSHVTIARGKHPALDAEALRVVKKMPKWTPGRNNGAPVRVTYMLPVTFKLQ